MTFPDKAYVNLENPDTRSFAIEDPHGLLAINKVKKFDYFLDHFSYLNVKNSHQSVKNTGNSCFSRFY